MSENGYNPTMNLRQQEVFVIAGGTTYVLQQLWRSDYEGFEYEWRDVEIIPWLKNVTVSTERELK